MTSTTIIGSTGMLGARILPMILDAAHVSTVHTISRRQPQTADPKLNAIVDTDTTNWAKQLSEIKPAPSIVLSALGTTLAQAGSIQNQWKIDHDLNIELARAAKAAGVKTFVFISSGGTRGPFTRFFPYSQMRIGVEDTIKELNFEHTVILRPRQILGEREGVAHAGGVTVNRMIRALGSISQGLQDMFGQERELICRAAVLASLQAAEGKAPSKYWVVEYDEILRIARDETTA
jgi:uncharacterized protein YbjT (DUF2867 family)